MSRLEQAVEDILIDLFRDGPTREFRDFTGIVETIERDFSSDSFTNKRFNHLFNRVHDALVILLEVRKIRERDVPEMAEFVALMYLIAYIRAERLEKELDPRDDRLFDDALEKSENFTRTLEIMADDLDNPRDRRGRGRDRDDRDDRRRDRGRDRNRRSSRDDDRDRDGFSSDFSSARDRSRNSRGDRGSRRSNRDDRDDRSDRKRKKVPSMNDVAFLTTPSAPAPVEDENILTADQWRLVDEENDKRQRTGRRLLTDEEAVRWIDNRARKSEDRQPALEDSAKEVRDAKVWGLVEGAKPDEAEWEERDRRRVDNAARRLREEIPEAEEVLVAQDDEQIEDKYTQYLDRLQYVETDDLTVRDQLALAGNNIFDPEFILSRPQRNRFNNTGNAYHIGFDANTTEVVRMIDEDGYQTYDLRKIEMDPANHRFANFSKPSISEPRTVTTEAVRNAASGNTVTLDQFGKEQTELASRRNDKIAAWEREAAAVPEGGIEPPKPEIDLQEFRIQDKIVVVDEVIYGIGAEDTDFRAHNRVIANRAESGFISTNYQYIAAALTPISYDAAVDRDVLKLFTLEVAGARPVDGSKSNADIAMVRMTDLASNLRRAQSLPIEIWTYIERRYTCVVNDILRNVMNCTVSMDSFYDDIKGLPEYITGRYGEHFTTKFLEAVYDRIDRFGVILGDNANIPGDMDDVVRAGVTMAVEYKRVLHIAGSVGALNISYEQTKEGNVIEFSRDSNAEIYKVALGMMEKEKANAQCSNCMIATEDGYRLQADASGITRPWATGAVMLLKSIGQFRY